MAKAYIPTAFKTYCHNTDAYINKTPKNIERMAFTLMRYLIDHELFSDSRIYFKTKNSWKAIQVDKPSNQSLSFTKITHEHGKKSYTVCVIDNIDPNDYFEENGDYLSMSFEGPLYHTLNRTEWLHPHDYVLDNLRNFFSTYGLYYELGDAWNFSLYEI